MAIQGYQCAAQIVLALLAEGLAQSNGRPAGYSETGERRLACMGGWSHGRLTVGRGWRSGSNNESCESDEGVLFEAVRLHRRVITLQNQDGPCYVRLCI
ncbi:hypothetical protein C8Q80DRAFT_894635 [Daedaleopsis nitida]|nr:hypothetical protein C8Q80DRAFT_894635 [Daedaleopsis nitida]